VELVPVSLIFLLGFNIYTRGKMSTTKEIIEGMKIITSKMTDEELDGYEINPAHDQIFCGKYKPSRMNTDEIKTLTEYGWFEDHESWSIFT